MKKTTIWLLAGIMAFAFFGLLYLQISSIRVTVKSRSDQFDEAVRRSLYEVARNLDIEETKRYLEQGYREMSRQGAFGADGFPFVMGRDTTVLLDDGTAVHTYDYSLSISKQTPSVFLSPKHGSKSISKTSFEMQENRRKRFFAQKELLDEVMDNLLHKAPSEPIDKRLDYRSLSGMIRAELTNNGIMVPFRFKVIDKQEAVLYSQGNYVVDNEEDEYTQALFQNDPPAHRYFLKVVFPTRGEYIASAISLFVPSVMFTVVLLITFIVSIVLIFRQKRLSEMKNDFINNMTHELKTPVSTISLAAQMLKDEAVMKSPGMFKHISTVINDETKRLSFQVNITEGTKSEIALAIYSPRVGNTTFKK